MTSDEDEHAIGQAIKKVGEKDVSIKINYEIGSSVNFLDVHIMNQNGELRTNIYHKLAAEPFVLPYHSDHPRHTHRNIPYAPLLVQFVFVHMSKTSTKRWSVLIYPSY